jgi:hypothetical protein
MQSVMELFHDIEHDVEEAKDNLLSTKIYQAHCANAHCGPEPVLHIGDHALLDTSNRHREYMQAGSGHVAKLMPQWDGPYTIVKAHPETSLYTLDLPASFTIHPTFHVSHLKPFRENDDDAFPSRASQNWSPFSLTKGNGNTLLRRSWMSVRVAEENSI